MASKKVLLAEDDLDDQILFRDFLQHRTDITLMSIVENGVELFETLEEIPSPEELPDIIILDQNMPKRNGRQTLELLKESNRYAQIPVVVYSTYADQKLIDNCCKIGACTVVSKPISKEGYDKMIDGFLQIIG